MKSINRIISTYKYLLGILYKQAPLIVIFTFILAVLSGALSPLTVYVNSHIFNGGLAVANRQAEFLSLIPFLIMFIMISLLPNLISLYINGYVEPRSMLILRSSFRGEMLKKLKTMKYEHFENEESQEIIDKAYNRAENSARHMFPMYINYSVSSFVGSLGSLIYLCSVKWWLIFLVLIPFALETYFGSKNNYNIYNELESYWNRERRYGILAGFLKNRDFVRESRQNQSSDFLIDTYRKRLNTRNKEYEKFYFKHLKQQFTKNNITKIASIINVIILLVLYLYGQMSIGIFISFSLMMFGTLFSQLSGSMILLRWGAFHFNFFDFYKKYFELSDENINADSMDPLTDSFEIEFRDVWFRYPGSIRDILKGLSFTVKNGEKLSIVGENGEGKSTMVKLLLGLFPPDKGEIFIGGRPLYSYTAETRTALFGTVFQDFNRYSITLKENIAVGEISKLDDKAALDETMKIAGVDKLKSTLEQGTDTLLGREFEGGVDLSGGEWQRIAMARAFFGDKPILILDEPTSQLDPMAESRLYSEFSNMANGKTTIFITHRLASTAITDRILVLSDGRVIQSGSHSELIKQGGLYAEMFESQKSWYDQSAKAEVINNA